MISFHNVSKSYKMRRFEKQVFSDVSFRIESGQSVGICGANGAGKSTLVRMIAGVEAPTSGHIVNTMLTSWPIGYASCFQASLTGADNARFIARIYGKPEDELIDFVQDFADLGPYLYQPVETYSAGMTARLAFAVSLSVDFECYLVDEVTAAGDERFRIRCEEALHARRESGTLIMISHSPETLRAYCSRGAVVYGGAVTFFDTIEEALDVHIGLQTRYA